MHWPPSPPSMILRLALLDALAPAEPQVMSTVSMNSEESVVRGEIV